MQCARLSHFIRFNPDGTLSRCGHMVHAPKFLSIEELDNSAWLSEIKQSFTSDQWPPECIKCKITEEVNQTSIRLNANNFHRLQKKSDYLCVGGVLDNTCNSACQFCNENFSTKIGSLKDKKYIKINNTKSFWKLPLERIVHLDINGGEPSASNNYKNVLRNLPDNIKSIRINTNCSLIIKEIQHVLDKGVKVTITVSFDGVGKIHDYVRWPINYNKFIENLFFYKEMPVDLNLWTTVNALNIGNFYEIQKFASDNNFNHAWAFLELPDVLHVKHKNFLTLSNKVLPQFSKHVAIANDNTKELLQFLYEQDSLRNINYKRYLF